MAERAGIEPAIDGIIRPLLVLKTSRNTSFIPSGYKNSIVDPHITMYVQ